MPKITITIEDKPGDLVEVIFTPTCEMLIQKHASGHGLTSAEGYALFVANRLREASKQQGSLRILIPRIGRA
jgi:hypothetical protein